MKTTASILFGLALVCALAASTTGCATRSGGLSPATINSGLASSNRVGVAIANGQMVSSIMDKDSVLGAYADVAKAAISNGQEVALIGLSHGADKKPNVETTSKTEETLQDVLAQGIKAAKSGGSEAELAKAGIGIVKGLAKLSSGDDAAPAADNSSANVFALFAGTGANAAGVGAMAEGRMTRVEAIKAARASSVTTTTDTRTETVSADGLATIRELAKLQAEIDKAKLSTGGAASPAPSRPGLTPAGEGSGGVTPPPVAPDSSGSGAVEPSDRPAYDTLTKKNYLYKTRLAKTNPVTRHDSAFLIPKDRPAVKGLYIPGQKVEESYFSKSEDRWILRLSGALPNTPASAVATYADGNSETFHIDSLAGRTDKPAGPYKPDVKPTTPAPVTPDTGAGTPPGESPAP